MTAPKKRKPFVPASTARRPNGPKFNRYIGKFTTITQISVTITDEERFKVAFEQFAKEAIHRRPAGYKVFLKALAHRINRGEKIDPTPIGVTFYTNHVGTAIGHRYGDDIEF